MTDTDRTMGERLAASHMRDAGALDRIARAVRDHTSAGDLARDVAAIIESTGRSINPPPGPRVCAHCSGRVITAEPDPPYTHTDANGDTWTHTGRGIEVYAWCDTPEPGPAVAAHAEYVGRLSHRR